MRILMLGDVIGKPGRRALRGLLPDIRREFDIDLVIANGENAAGGLGLTPETANELFESSVDVITSGNHIWSHKSIIPALENDLAIIRPLNYPSQVPGKGYLLKGKKRFRIDEMLRDLIDLLDSKRTLKQVIRELSKARKIQATTAFVYSQQLYDEGVIEVSQPTDKKSRKSK